MSICSHSYLALCNLGFWVFLCFTVFWIFYLIKQIYFYLLDLLCICHDTDRQPFGHKPDCLSNRPRLPYNLRSYLKNSVASSSLTLVWLFTNRFIFLHFQGEDKTDSYTRASSLPTDVY